MPPGPCRPVCSLRPDLRDCREEVSDIEIVGIEIEAGGGYGNIESSFRLMSLVVAGVFVCGAKGCIAGASDSFVSAAEDSFSLPPLCAIGSSCCSSTGASGLGRRTFLVFWYFWSVKLI